MQKILCTLALTLVLTLTAGLGLATTITVDGNLGDWTGINPLLTDRSDYTAGPDLDRLYMTNNENFLYIMALFYRFDSGWFYPVFDMDNAPSTGFLVNGIGMEKALTASRDRAYIGNSDDGSWSSSDYGYLEENYVTWDRGFEVAIPWEILIDSDQLPEVIGVFTMNDHAGSSYFQVEKDNAPVPEPATVLLLGTGLIGIAGVSRKKLKS